MECSAEAEVARKKKSKNKIKMRFSEEQIGSLESIFETETKVEPRKKAELARELGLEPRQIAIWFQNRRARWKSKQIEQEYNVLKANYDHLSSRFEFMMKEKQSLLIQMQKLSEVVEKRRDRSTKDRGMEGNDMGFMQELDKKGLSYEEVRTKSRMMCGEERCEDLNVDCVQRSLETGGDLIDESSENFNWWNFWS